MYFDNDEKDRKNNMQFIWSVSYSFYSITFIGLLGYVQFQHAVYVVLGSRLVFVTGVNMYIMCK